MQRREKEFIITRQLLKSSTSIGANMEEAQGAISGAEFVCKTQISLKEAKETHYWLRILSDSEIADPDLVKPMLRECAEIIAILTAILRTAKSNLKSNDTKATFRDR